MVRIRGTESGAARRTRREAVLTHNASQGKSHVSSGIMGLLSSLHSAHPESNTPLPLSPGPAVIG